MVKVTYVEFGGQEHVVDVPIGHTLMEGARDNGVPGIDADCGGACACSTCHVHVPAEWMAKLEEKDEMEVDMLDFAYQPNPETSRLSCQVRISPELEGMIVNLPERQI